MICGASCSDRQEDARTKVVDSQVSLLLALIHGNAVVIDKIESEVIVLLGRKFAECAAVGGVQLSVVLGTTKPPCFRGHTILDRS